MLSNTITITELVKDHKAVSEMVLGGKSFVVISKSKPMFKIVPIKQVLQKNKQTTKIKLPKISVKMTGKVDTQSLYEQASWLNK